MTTPELCVDEWIGRSWDCDSRISQPMRGNGLVAREVDGTPSHVIRMGIDDVLRIALESVVKDQDKRARCPGFGEHSEACETQCEARGDCCYLVGRDKP